MFYKFNICLPKTTTCIGLQAEQILSVNILYLYIFNFGRCFCGFFYMLFPEGPAPCDKNILNSFLLYCTSIYMISKSVSKILKIYFKLEILIFLFFVLHGVSFSRYVQLKSSFSDKKSYQSLT